jgi:hypothetical protein
MTFGIQARTPLLILQIPPVHSPRVLLHMCTVPPKDVRINVHGERGRGRLLGVYMRLNIASRRVLYNGVMQVRLGE